MCCTSHTPISEETKNILTDDKVGLLVHFGGNVSVKTVGGYKDVYSEIHEGTIIDHLIHTSCGKNGLQYIPRLDRPAIGKFFDELSR